MEWQRVINGRKEMTQNLLYSCMNIKERIKKIIKTPSDCRPFMNPCLHIPHCWPLLRLLCLFIFLQLQSHNTLHSSAGFQISSEKGYLYFHIREVGTRSRVNVALDHWPLSVWPLTFFMTFTIACLEVLEISVRGPRKDKVYLWLSTCPYLIRQLIPNLGAAAGAVD